MRPVGIISRSLDNSIDDTGQITRQIPFISNDEFGRLAAQFNEMREQLNDANARLQSKIDLADSKLTENNHRLKEQAVELQRMNVELQRIAVTDSLTGLYNRRYFEDVVRTDLALSLRHGDKNSILIIDIDYFKKINDTHGHKTGDKVLTELARVLGAETRKSDLVCRMGGEEFILLCRRAEKEEAIQVAEKIRESIAGHAFTGVNTGRIAVTVSVGVVSFPDGATGATVEDYIHCADLALYRSKAAGRNCVTHYADMAGVVG